MVKNAGQVQLGRYNSHAMLADGPAGQERPLLFVPVHPHESLSAAGSMRSEIKRHIAVQWRANFPSPNQAIPAAQTPSDDMGKHLARFRLEKGRHKARRIKSYVPSEYSMIFFQFTAVNICRCRIEVSRWSYGESHLHPRILRDCSSP